jgi:hypothetical protein
MWGITCKTLSMHPTPYKPPNLLQTVRVILLKCYFIFVLSNNNASKHDYTAPIMNVNFKPNVYSKFFKGSIYACAHVCVITILAVFRLQNRCRKITSLLSAIIH